MNRKELQKKLLSLSEPDYQKFSQNLSPGASHVLGVRLPLVRGAAKHIAKENWRDFLADTSLPLSTLSMEETMIDGMVLGYAKDMKWEEFLERTAQFIPRIDGWSVCDSVCCTLKRVKENRLAFWEFLQPYLSSDKEFELRFAAVMLLNFYIEEEWIERVIHTLMIRKPTKYYAKMGVAWALSICWISFPETTQALLDSASLEEDIYLKTIQKVMESTRTSKSEKERLRTLRKNLLLKSK